MGKRYAIRNLFLTLQGEGARTGARSLFVRFAGCNLWDGRPEHRQLGRGSCARWCDTDFVRGEQVSVENLLEQMESLWPQQDREPRWCVVTGGEPTLQLDASFVDRLHAAGWLIALETNGTIDPVDQGRRVLAEVDHLCCSPKRGGEVVIPSAHELKVVLPGDPLTPWSDNELLALRERLQPEHAFVQPQDAIDVATTEKSFLGGQKTDAAAGELYLAHVDRCIRFVHSHPTWRLSLQTHKYLRIP
jgi:7-carboxy-7-deazaguanine synthase